MLDTLDNVIRRICKVVMTVIMIIGLAMLAISLVHIFCRYVLNSSLSWSEELLKILLVWFCLLSASYIAVRREHVSIVVFKQKFPKHVEHTMDLCVQVLMCIASLVVCYIGIKMIIKAGSRVTPALGFPYGGMYAAVAVSFALMALYEFRNVLYDFVRPGEKPAIVENTSEDIDFIENNPED